MTLNEMKEEFKHLIAPTDCRFRTDIKQLELGNLGKYNLDIKILLSFIQMILNQYYEMAMRNGRL